MRKVKFSVIRFLLLFTFVYSFAQTGAKYLVISHDNFINAIRPLVEWKTKKGVKAVCVPLSQIGSTPSQIKSYIQNAYNTWNPRPEYVLLVGSPDLLPSYDFTGYSDYSDDYYANMTGNYEIEFCIGRFHCATVAQCSVVVAKSIGYEKNPPISDSTWFKKGTTIVREDIPPDAYYQADTRYIRNLWLNAGFTQTDSFQNTRGNDQDDVVNAINNGRTFVVFRGQSVGHWWEPFYFEPDVTENGNKLPVVVSGTCATMTLTPWENMLGDDFLCAGTVQNPKGAVGFFGTTFIGSYISQQRGIVTRGFFRALYQDSIVTMGGAAKRAKFILDSILPNQTRYVEWNLLGDPELNIWTKLPKELTVTHDSVIFLQPTNFQVLVKSNTVPVGHALVCVMMDTTVYYYGYTNSSGLITFSFTPQHIGSLQVTVTGHNYIPYEGTAAIRSSNVVSISGSVKYYSNQNSVESTKVVLSGSMVDTTLTDSFGFYSFTTLPVLQNYTVSPYKINSARPSAISSYDAALILRHSVGIITLDSLQRIAADVSGNGQITSFDAALVMQYSVAIRDHFPVGAEVSDTVDWAFRPPSRSYLPIMSSQINQNYTAILYGDVSGNWHSTDGEVTLASIGMNLSQNEEKEEYKVFPIRATSAKDVISADIVLSFNPEEIVIKGVTLGKSAADYLIAWSSADGLVRIGLAGFRPLSGNAELVIVSYSVKECALAQMPIKIQTIVLNEGQDQVINKTTDGVTENSNALLKRYSVTTSQLNRINSNIAIYYSLPNPGNILLAIYDIRGKLIKTLVQGFAKEGNYCQTWNNQDNQGRVLNSGVYFLQLQAGEYELSRKLVLLR